jgi:hypothetical protein
VLERELLAEAAELGAEIGHAPSVTARPSRGTPGS